MAEPLSLEEQRELVRQILDEDSAADAPTAYYMLFHNPARSALFTWLDSAGRAAGFVGRFQTGIDLFRPLVTLSCAGARIAADLLERALIPGRPYILFASLAQFSLASSSFQIDNEQVLHIYRLDRKWFQPVVNVLVQSKRTSDGLPRCEIISSGMQAVAGVNWQSPEFAELYVYTDPAARQRGWGISVASALADMVLNSGRTPIYLVEPENTASRELAEKLGFADTGARQIYADVSYLGHPGANRR